MSEGLINYEKIGMAKLNAECRDTGWMHTIDA